MRNTVRAFLAIASILTLTIYTPVFAAHYGATAYTCNMGPSSYNCYACCWSSKAKNDVVMSPSMSCDVPGNPSYYACEKSQALKHAKLGCQGEAYIGKKPGLQYGTWKRKSKNQTC